MLAKIRKHVDKHILLLLGSVLLISMGHSASNSSYILCGDILFLIAILIGKPKDDIVSYAFIVPFTGIMPVGAFRIFYCLWISIIKLVRIPYSKNKIVILFAAIYFGFNFIFFDFLLGGSNSLVTLYSFMLYIIIFMVKSRAISLDVEKLALSLGLSCFLILRLILVTSEGLDIYVESSNDQVKLGEDARDIGGAMGVSLYTCVGFSIALIFSFIKKGIGKIIAVSAMFFFVFLALYALSRTFFSSLALAIFCSFFIALFSGDARGVASYVKIFVPILILAIIAIPIFGQYFSSDIAIMTEKLIGLFDGGPGSRARIWASVFDYLAADPMTLLFGAGTNRYSEMNGTIHYAFHGYGAHCLYFDVILSFGLVGFLILSLLLYILFKSSKWYCSSQNTSCQQVVPFSIMILPLLIYAFSQLAQGSFRDTPTYIYPITLLIVTFGLLSKK